MNVRLIDSTCSSSGTVSAFILRHVCQNQATNKAPGRTSLIGVFVSKLSCALTAACSCFVKAAIDDLLSARNFRISSLPFRNLEVLAFFLEHYPPSKTGLSGKY